MAESSRKRQRVPPQREMTARHKEKLEILEGFEIQPSRVLDLDILQTMGWDSEVLGYIHAIGWDFLLKPHPLIYPTATREFLATVGITESENSCGVKIYSVDFWMNGGYRSVTLDEFNIQAGFFERTQQLEYMDAVCEAPEGVTLADMWKALTGHVDYHRGAKGTRLPTTLRICHKLLSGSIHARLKSPESVTRPDLLALYCMATGRRANPGYFFIEHVKNLGAREGSEARQGYIMMATLLSHLAQTWGCPDGEEPGELAPKPISAATLVNMRIITRAGDHFVRVDAPSYDFTDLLDQIDLSGGEDPQSGAGTSQQTREARIEARLDALQQSIDTRFERAQQGIDRTQLGIEALQRNFDGLSVWLHSQFPHPPQDPPAEQ